MIRFLLFSFLTFGCSVGKGLGVFEDHDRCFISKIEDNNVVVEIPLSDLPLWAEEHQGEGLWCTRNHLRGSKQFSAYDESWAISFYADKNLHVKAFPMDDAHGGRASQIQLPLTGAGCIGIQRPGKIFEFSELFTSKGNRFSVALICRK